MRAISTATDLETLLVKGAVERLQTPVARATAAAKSMSHACDVSLRDILTEPGAGIQALLQDTPFASRVESYDSIGADDFRWLCEAAAWRSAFLTIELALTKYKASVHFVKKSFINEKLVTVAEVVPYGLYREWEIQSSLAAQTHRTRTEKDEETLAKAKKVGETLRRTARLPPLSEKQKEALSTAEVFNGSTMKKGPLRTSFEAAKKVAEDAEIQKRKIRQSYLSALQKVEDTTERNAVLREAEQRAVLLAAARYEWEEIKFRARTENPNTSMEGLLQQFIKGFREVLHLQAQTGASAFAALLSQWTAPAAEGGPPQLSRTDKELDFASSEWRLPPTVNVLKTVNEVLQVVRSKDSKQVTVSAYRIPFGRDRGGEEREEQEEEEIQFPFMGRFSTKATLLAVFNT